MMTYPEALKRAQDQEAVSKDYARLTNQQLTDGIAAITEDLKKSMPNHERIFQGAVRKGLRAELDRRQLHSQGVSE